MDTKNNQDMYRYRLLASVVMEAAAPLAAGSGQKSIMTDATVARDANGLPYIPGTSIAGVIRHAMKKHADMDKWMGFQRATDGKGDKEDKGQGSLLAVTEARILGSDGSPADGLIPDPFKDPLLSHLKVLPIRQHVRLTHKGVADNRGKFDEEVVPEGARFTFEMELLSDSADREQSERLMDDIIGCIRADSFRLGGGSRSGFGKMRIVSVGRRTIDLQDKADLADYLGKSSRLDPAWKGWKSDSSPEKVRDGDFISYTLTIRPEDFMFFGSGFGRGEADLTYVRNPAIAWDSGKGTFVSEDQLILIPASSVKGALSHRTAYWYNMLEGVFADKLPPDEIAEHTGDRNTAVRSLFGTAGDGHGENKARGLALFSDVTAKKTSGTRDKVLNHVSIDRFTGGAIDGALFNEETLFAKGTEFTLEILVSKEAEKEPNVLKAFEKALDDVKDGLLPLGGGVNRGNGTFRGSWRKE